MQLLAEIEQLKKDNLKLSDDLDIARDQQGHLEVSKKIPYFYSCLYVH